MTGFWVCPTRLFAAADHVRHVLIINFVEGRARSHGQSASSRRVMDKEDAEC